MATSAREQINKAIKNWIPLQERKDKNAVTFRDIRALYPCLDYQKVAETNGIHVLLSLLHNFYWNEKKGKQTISFGALAQGFWETTYLGPAMHRVGAPLSETAETCEAFAALILSLSKKELLEFLEAVALHNPSKPVNNFDWSIVGLEYHLLRSTQNSLLPSWFSPT